MQQGSRRALVVRGGWEGHSPVEATERFIPFLEEHGFEVTVRDDLDAYDDEELLARTDLVLQCWTQGEISDDRVARLSAAVAAGTGLAGWHGGIIDAFRMSPEYLQLTGGQFATHPGGVRDHAVEVVPARAEHPIVAGIAAALGPAHRAVLEPGRRAQRRAGDVPLPPGSGHALAAGGHRAGGVDAGVGRGPGVRLDDRPLPDRPGRAAGAHADRARAAVGCAVALR